MGVSDLGKAYSTTNLLKRLDPETKATFMEQKQYEKRWMENRQNPAVKPVLADAKKTTYSWPMTTPKT